MTSPQHDSPAATTTRDVTVDLTDRGFPPEEDDRSITELLSALTTDLSDLMKTQLELAKVELKEEAGRAGTAAGMGAVGAVLAWCAVLLLGVAAAWGLAEGLPTWLSFLVVAVVYGAIGAALVLSARSKITQLQLPPPQTNESLQEDARWLQQHRS